MFLYIHIAHFVVKDQSKISPTRQHKLPDQTAFINCDSAVPPTWEFDEESLKAHNIENQGSTLKITDLQLDNGGVYGCTGVDSVTKKYFHAIAYLHVLGKLLGMQWALRLHSDS